MKEKTIEQLLDLVQAKLDGMVKNENTGNLDYEYGYGTAIKEIAERAGLNKDNYGVTEI